MKICCQELLIIAQSGHTGRRRREEEKVASLRSRFGVRTDFMISFMDKPIGKSYKRSTIVI